MKSEELRCAACGTNSKSTLEKSGVPFCDLSLGSVNTNDHPVINKKRLWGKRSWTVLLLIALTQKNPAMETMTGLVRPMRLERTTFRVGV